MKPSSSKTSTAVVQQDTSPTNPIRKAREKNKWSIGIILDSLNETKRLLHAFGLITSTGYLGESTYKGWEKGKQPQEEHALLLCELFGKSRSELGIRRKTQLVKRIEFLAATSASIFNTAIANEFARAFSISNHSLSSDLPSSFASYSPSDFNTLHNTLMVQANASANHHDILTVFHYFISNLQERFKTASGVDKTDLLRELSTYNASASWISLARGDHSASCAQVKEAMTIATELNLPWLKSYILCRKSILALREKKWKDAVIFAEAAQKYGKKMDIRLHVYSLLLQAEGYSLLRDNINCYTTLEEAYAVANTFPNHERPKNEIANFCTESYVQSTTGMCEMYLNPQKSIITFAATLTNWPSQYEHKSAFYLMKGALAQIFVRDPEQASLWAKQSFAIAQKTGDILVLKELEILDKRMQSEQAWKKLESVSSFHEALSSHPPDYY